MGKILGGKNGMCQGHLLIPTWRNTPEEVDLGDRWIALTRLSSEDWDDGR